MPNERIAYVSGPVDAEAVYSEYVRNGHPDNFGTSYLQQFYSVSDEHGMEPFVVTTHETLGEYARDIQISAKNIAMPADETGGIKYHVRMIAWSLKVLRHLFKNRPDIVILTAGRNYFFVLAMVKLIGAKVIVSYHCALYSPKTKDKPIERIYRFLNRKILGWAANAYMFVSQEVGRQVKQQLPSTNLSCERFFSTYDRRHFEKIGATTWQGSGTFKLLYCGRVEQNKGVFDLLDIAEKIKTDRQIALQIDLCGDGNALAELRDEIIRRDLGDQVTAHGNVNSDTLWEYYDQCHAVVVPTRSNLEEGFNKVCAEAVMARRPVITSIACPALEDVRDAAVEAVIDDVDSYHAAVIRLATDQSFYRSKVDATEHVRELFFDNSRSYGAALTRALRAIIKSGDS